MYRSSVTAPHVVPFLPGFNSPAAGEFFAPGIPAYVPTDIDINQVNADVGDDGVSAPPGEDVAALRQVVSDARAQGIDLKVVVIKDNPPIDTPLRDIATEVGEAYPGSTVLTLSPSYAGTYSHSFDRVILEAGQDVAKTGDPVQSSKNFVSQLTTPDFPWTAWTIVLVLGVAVATVVTRVLQVRSKRSTVGEAASEDAVNTAG